MRRSVADSHACVGGSARRRSPVCASRHVRAGAYARDRSKEGILEHKKYRRNLATGRPLRALRARTFVAESKRFDSEANGIFEEEIC